MEAGGVESVTNAVGSGTNLVIGTLSNPVIQQLVAGTNIDFDDSSGTSIIINNTSPATSVALDSAGGIQTLVVGASGPTLTIRGLTPGDGITLDGSSGVDVVINNTSPATSVTLNDAETIGDNEASLTVAGSTGPDLLIKTLIGGANVTLVNNDTNVTISATASSAADSVESLSATGGGAAVNPTVTINQTLITTSGTGTATGTLTNGLVNGFRKVVTLVAGTVPYVLTVASCINPQGATGTYVLTFQQPGMSYTLIWDLPNTAWVVQASSLPTYQGPTVIVSLTDSPIPPYSTGNITQVGTTDLVGSETNFTSEYIGGTITFPTAIVDKVGTASQSVYSITGVGTTFNANMVGGTFVWADGNSAIIQIVTSSTTLTVNETYTETASTFTITYYLPLTNVVAVLSPTELTVSTANTYSNVAYILTMPQIITAVASDNQVVATGLNCPNLTVTTTHSVFLAASLFVGGSGGGELYISSGNYFMNGRWNVNGSYYTIRGSGGTFLYQADVVFKYTMVLYGNYIRITQCIFGVYLGYTSTTTDGPILYGTNGGISGSQSTFCTIDHCTFLSLMDACSPGQVDYLTWDSNLLVSCRGGLQPDGPSTCVKWINNIIVDDVDDCITCPGVTGGVISNNYIDMYEQTTGGPGTHGAHPINCAGTSITITGNCIANVGGPGIQLNGTGCTVTGNTFYNCAPYAPAEDDIYELNDNTGIIFISDPKSTGNVIVGNTFYNYTRSICILGYNNYVGPNNYYTTYGQEGGTTNIPYRNVIDFGNRSDDCDTFTVPIENANVAIINNLETYYTYTVSAQASTIGWVTGTFTAAADYTSVVQAINVNPVFGATDASYSITIGCTAGPVTGCTLSVYVDDSGGTPDVLWQTILFDVPQTVGGGITVQTPTLIPLTGLTLVPQQYRFTITPPGAQVFDVAYVHGSRGATNNAPGTGNEWVFLLTYYPYTPNPLLQIGNVGDEAGQVQVTGALNANALLISDLTQAVTVNSHILGTGQAVDSSAFIAGGSGVAPRVFCTNSSSFVYQQIIWISGAATSSNNGFFEVQSSSVNAISIVGIGNPAQTIPDYQYVGNQFTTDTTVQGTVYPTTLGITLQSTPTGSLTMPSLPTYASDADADADPNLPVYGLYLLTGSRGVWQKPP